MNLSIVCVLLQQPTKNCSSSYRLAHVNEGCPPGQEQPRIIRRMIRKWLQNLDNFGIVLQHGIAEPQNLANKSIIRMSFNLALQRRNCLLVQFSAKAR